MSLLFALTFLTAQVDDPDIRKPTKAERRESKQRAKRDHSHLDYCTVPLNKTLLRRLVKQNKIRNNNVKVLRKNLAKNRVIVKFGNYKAKDPFFNNCINRNFKNWPQNESGCICTNHRNIRLVGTSTTLGTWRAPDVESR